MRTWVDGNDLMVLVRPEGTKPDHWVYERPIGTLYRYFSRDGYRDVRVTLDGVDVASDCELADEEQGFVRLAVRGADGEIVVDHGDLSGGRILRRDVLGVVKITIDEAAERMVAWQNPPRLEKAAA